MQLSDSLSAEPFLASFAAPGQPAKGPSPAAVDFALLVPDSAARAAVAPSSASAARGATWTGSPGLKLDSGSGPSVIALIAGGANFTASPLPPAQPVPTISLVPSDPGTGAQLSGAAEPGLAAADEAPGSPSFSVPDLGGSGLPDASAGGVVGTWAPSDATRTNVPRGAAMAPQRPGVLVTATEAQSGSPTGGNAAHGPRRGSRLVAPKPADLPEEAWLPFSSQSPDPLSRGRSPAPEPIPAPPGNGGAFSSDPSQSVICPPPGPLPTSIVAGAVPPDAALAGAMGEDVPASLPSQVESPRRSLGSGNITARPSAAVVANDLAPTGIRQRVARPETGAVLELGGRIAPGSPDGSPDLRRGPSLSHPVPGPFSADTPLEAAESESPVTATGPVSSGPNRESAALGPIAGGLANDAMVRSGRPFGTETGRVRPAEPRVESEVLSGASGVARRAEMTASPASAAPRVAAELPFGGGSAVPSIPVATALQVPQQVAAERALGAPAPNDPERGEMPAYAARVWDQAQFELSSQEKFAARAFDGSVGKSLPAERPLKLFQTASAKGDTNMVPSIGTAAANSAPPMSSATLNPHSESASAVLSREVDPMVEAAARAGSSADDPMAPSGTSTTAQRAVETVLVAADWLTGRDRQSVNLQFSLGGAELVVRVEMRGHHVHTFFRSDSSEVCTALAREWQACSVAAPERFVRFEPPAISSGSGDAAGTFAGDTPSRQHHAPPSEFIGEEAGPGRGLSTATPAAAAVPRPSPSLVGASTSRHLHTHA